jgi:hypothetical protein
VSKDKAGHGSGAAAHHMLVGAADIGRDYFQDDRVLDAAAVRRLKLRIVDIADFHLAGPHVDDASVPAHTHSSYGFRCMDSVTGKTGDKLSRPICLLCRSADHSASG